MTAATTYSSSGISISLEIDDDAVVILAYDNDSPKCHIDGDLLLISSAYAGASLNISKTILNNRLACCLRALQVHAKDSSLDKVHLFVHMGVNKKAIFKSHLPRISGEYKGGRPKKGLPSHFSDLRNYLITEYNTVSLTNMESDDTIGLACNPAKDIIASYDKDFNCVPCNLYDWRDKGTNAFKSSHITEDVANLNFYRKLLHGDTSDNIKGVPGIGVGRARSLSLDHESKMFYYVYTKYYNYVKKQSTNSALVNEAVDVEKLASEWLVINSCLLWTCRRDRHFFPLSGIHPGWFSESYSEHIVNAFANSVPL